MSNVLLYAITVLVWGSTWLGIEFQLGVVHPEVSVFYRYVLAAAMLLAWCAARGLDLRFGWRAHGYFFLLGMLLFGLNYIATYSAQQYITSALNAVAFSTMLWMNIINARIFFGVRATPRVLVGAALGIGGIVVLFWPEVQSVSFDDATLVGAALCLSGALIASFGNMVSQQAQKLKLPVLQSNAWGMVYGALLVGAIAAARGREFSFDPSPGYVLSLAYLALFGSIVAFGTYLTLLGRIGAHKAGYAVVMFPVVALVLSVLFEGLTIEPHLLAGVALVLVGNVFVLRGRRAAAQQGRRPATAESPGGAAAVVEAE